MGTNYSRTLYKDYEAALLGKQEAEKQVAILNRQCKKLEVYAEGLERESDRRQGVIDELNNKVSELERSCTFDSSSRIGQH